MRRRRTAPVKGATVHVYGKPLRITALTVIRARRQLIRGYRRVIDDCRNETDPWFQGWDQSRKQKLIRWQRRQINEARAGKYDSSLAFLQTCIHLQTGVTVPILS